MKNTNSVMKKLLSILCVVLMVSVVLYSGALLLGLQHGFTTRVKGLLKLLKQDWLNGCVIGNKKTVLF